MSKAIKPVNGAETTKQATKRATKLASDVAKRQARFRKTKHVPTVTIDNPMIGKATFPSPAAASVVALAEMKAATYAGLKRYTDSKITLALTRAKEQLRVALYQCERSDADAIAALNASQQACEALAAMSALQGMRNAIKDVIFTSKTN